MKIALVAPIAGSDLSPLIAERQRDRLPRGYEGAPLTSLLAAELLRRGHEVLALSTDASLQRPAGPFVSPDGRLRFCLVPQRRRAFVPQGLRCGRALDLFAQERRALQAVLRDERPDVVHAHWAYEFAWAAQSSGLPVLLTLHDDPFEVARHTGTAYRWIRAGMAWHVMRRARQLTAPSPYLCAALAPRCTGPVALVPNPVADAAFALYRVPRLRARSFGLVSNGFGALKNTSVAMRAFALLRQTCPDVEMHLWGHGHGAGEAAEAWARAQGLADGLRFHGALPHAALLSALSLVDVLVHPALEESFGVVLVEAMAMGIPVIAGLRSGAVPWVVDNPACLVDVSDIDSLANALRRHCAGGAWRVDQSDAGRRRSQCFTAAAVAEQFIARYDMLLQQPPLS